jgi:hypothetical protein
MVLCQNSAAGSCRAIRGAQSLLNATDPKPLPSTVVRDDEGRLVSAAKAGDVVAFEELVNRYERKIFRLGMNITQNREDAEDVMQDAFLKSYQNLAFLYLAGADRGQRSADEAAQAASQSGVAG